MLTLATFKQRFDAALLAQLTDPAGAACDDVKVQHALDDAAAQIAGYTYRLPVMDQPPGATLAAHQASLALYALAGNRPGVEFDSIRARHKASIAWLEGLTASGSSIGIGGSASAQTALMDVASLAQFGGADDGAD
jgi:phage gp36-like protein